MSKENKKFWIADAVKHKGALRKALHVKSGKTIAESKLEKAEHSKSPIMRKRAVLANTLSKFKKK